MDVEQILHALISFPSVSQHSNMEITDHVARTLRGMNPNEVEQLQYRDSEGELKACCAARWGDGPGGLAYFGHTDVVPADDWQGPGGDPFLATTRDGRVYGRGACDMKGSLAMAMAAAKARSASQFQHPLYLAFTADEEIGYAGARHLAENSAIYREMTQGQPKAIIGEPTNLRVVHAHKGTLLWRIIARGRAAHSSTGMGRNANLQMIPFLTELKTLYDDAEQDPQWRDERFHPSTLTMNIGLSDHTRAINITAPISVCTVYVRPAPDMDITPFQNRMREVAEDFGLEFLVERRGAPLWTDPDSAFVQEALAVTETAQAETVCYGTDGCELTALKQKIVWGPGDIAQAHTADEWIELRQLQRGVQLVWQDDRSLVSDMSDSRSDQDPDQVGAHPVHLRQAHREDAARVHAFLRPFMRQRIILRRDEHDIQWLTRHGFVAEAGDDLIGFAAVEVYSRKLAELQCLAVSQAYRGLGLGKQLVELCVQRARDLHVVELMAITASDNLFRDCGFDYSLPNQKKALFINTTGDQDHEDEDDSSSLDGLGAEER